MPTAGFVFRGFLIIPDVSENATDTFGAVAQEKEDEDGFQKLGVQLPAHLNTEFRRWCSLFLVTVLGCISIGPLQAWPTLEPLLIQEGVWAGKNQVTYLSQVVQIGLICLTISRFFAGLVYDALGPRVLSAIGAFGAALCLAGMAIAIQVQQLNGLLWIARPTCLIVGAFASVGCYAWLWLLPNHSNIVAAIIGIIQILSDGLALVAVALNKFCGVRIQVYFAILAGLSACTVPMLLILVPSQQELLRISHIVMEQRSTSAVEASSREYGATGDYHADREPAPLNEEPATTMAQYLMIIFAGPNLFPIYLDLLGKAKAIELVDILGAVVPTSGALWMFSLGWFAERFDLAQTTGWLIIPTVVLAVALSSTNFDIQIVGQLLFVLLSNTWRVLQVRFAMVYGPPELFGSITGAFSLPQGLSQLAMVPFCNWMFANGGRISDVPNQNLFPILRSIDFWCIITVISSVFALLYWWYYPIPAPGSTTMADIRNAAVDLDVERDAMETQSLLESERSTCKPPDQQPCTPPEQPNCKRKRSTSARNGCAYYRMNQV